MTKRLLVWLTGTLLLACSGGGGGEGSMAVAVSALSSADVTRVLVTVTAPDMAKPVEQELVLRRGQWEGVVGGIPVGTSRLFTAEAFDAAGTVVYRGELPGVTVEAGASAVVALRLQEVDPAPPFGNSAPHILGLIASARELVPGGRLAMEVQAQDADGDPLHITWSAGAGSWEGAESASATWTAPEAEGLYLVSVVVRDDHGARTQADYGVQVRLSAGRGQAEVQVSFNNAPLVASVQAEAGRMDVGETVRLMAQAHDADGDTLAYAWSADCDGAFSDPAVAEPTFTLQALPESGRCALTCVVTDGRGATNRGTLTLGTGPQVTVNVAPEVVASFQSARTMLAEEVVVLRVQAEDPEGSALTFTWSAPDGGTLSEPHDVDGTSEVRWTAPSPLARSTYRVAVAVADASGAVTRLEFEVAAEADPEVCDGVDNDGDGHVDEADGSTTPWLPLTCEVLTVSFERGGYNLLPGEREPLRVLAAFSHPGLGVRADVTSQMSWSATGPGLSVSAGGVVEGTGVGEGRVLATFRGLTASAPVRVWDPARLAQLTGLTVGSERSLMTHGECQHLTVTAAFSDGTSEDVTGSAHMSAGVAGRVLDGGLFVANGTFTNGYANVQALLRPDGPSAAVDVYMAETRFEGRCADARVPGRLLALDIPAVPALWPTEAILLRAEASFEDGSVRDVSGQVAWDAVATPAFSLMPEGFVVTHGVGTGQVLAHFGGRSATRELRVEEAGTLGELRRLRLYTPRPNLAQGAENLVWALGTYSWAPERSFNLTAAATWTSSAPGVASLSGNRLSAHAPGLTALSATYAGLLAEQNVRVWEPARLASVTRFNVEVPVVHSQHGSCQQLRAWVTFNDDPNDTEDVAASSVWTDDPAWDLGHVSHTGFFRSDGSQVDTYETVTASFGRGLLQPDSVLIGVWGPRDSGTCTATP